MIKNIRHQKEDFSKTPYPHNKICETKQENAKENLDKHAENDDDNLPDHPDADKNTF